ncbi:MAG: XrtA system polysaccharide deacetylase [Nitrospinota bacterium]
MFTVNQGKIKNFLTVDVEEYFHVSAFRGFISRDTWDQFESRVVPNTRKLLEIFEESGGVKGTFFILGWVAERNRDLVKEIASQGHEIASHSYAHRCIFEMTADEFREDLKRGKDILEDITGQRVVGFRAPSFSITRDTLWVYEILGELGFKYDSSVFPIVHDLYGIPGAPRFVYKVGNSDLMEYPMSTAPFLGCNLPVSGGGYFRIFPYWLIKYGATHINRKEGRPYMFYIHPWEVDPGQPRFRQAKLTSRLRHYTNLKKTEGRLKRLLRDFSFYPVRDSLLHPASAGEGTHP